MAFKIITLQLPFPPSTNSNWRHVGNKTLLSEKAKKYRKAVTDAVTLRGRAGLPLTGPLAIDALLLPPNKARRDLDNFDGKCLWDALRHAGVIEDDSQFVQRTSAWGKLQKGGLVIVKISQVEAAYA